MLALETVPQIDEREGFKCQLRDKGYTILGNPIPVESYIQAASTYNSMITNRDPYLEREDFRSETSIQREFSKVFNFGTTQQRYLDREGPGKIIGNGRRLLEELSVMHTTLVSTLFPQLEGVVVSQEELEERSFLRLLRYSQTNREGFYITPHVDGTLLSFALRLIHSI